MMDKPEHILGVARGDIGVSRHVKSSLSILASTSPDPGFRRLVTDVLEGRMSVRELVKNEAFTSTLDKTLPAGLAEFESLSTEDRERLAAAARDEMANTAGRESVQNRTAQPPIEENEADDEDWNPQGGILSSSW